MARSESSPFLSSKKSFFTLPKIFLSNQVLFMVTHSSEYVFLSRHLLIGSKEMNWSRFWSSDHIMPQCCRIFCSTHRSFIPLVTTVVYCRECFCGLLHNKVSYVKFCDIFQWNHIYQMDCYPVATVCVVINKEVGKQLSNCFYVNVKAHFPEWSDQGIDDDLKVQDHVPALKLGSHFAVPDTII